MNLLKTLTQLGMSERQANIYIVGIKFITFPASRVAEEIKINRTTVYHELLTMVESGFTSKYKRNGVRFFEMISPQELLNNFKSSLNAFEENIPDLISIRPDVYNDSAVRYFEGIEGVKSMYLDKLYHGKTIYSFINPQNIKNEIEKFMYGEYLEKKVQREVHSNVIIENIPGKSRFYELSVKQNRNIKCIEPGILKLYGELTLYGDDYVSFIDSNLGTSGMIIKNHGLYSLLKSFFDLTRKIL